MSPLPTHLLLLLLSTTSLFALSSASLNNYGAQRLPLGGSLFSLENRNLAPRDGNALGSDCGGDPDCQITDFGCGCGYTDGTWITDPAVGGVAPSGGSNSTSGGGGNSTAPPPSSSTSAPPPPPPSSSAPPSPPPSSSAAPPAPPPSSSAAPSAPPPSSSAPTPSAKPCNPGGMFSDGCGDSCGTTGKCVSGSAGYPTPLLYYTCQC